MSKASRLQIRINAEKMRIDAINSHIENLLSERNERQQNIASLEAAILDLEEGEEE